MEPSKAGLASNLSTCTICCKNDVTRVEFASTNGVIHSMKPSLNMRTACGGELEEVEEVALAFAERRESCEVLVI